MLQRRAGDGGGAGTLIGCFAGLKERKGLYGLFWGLLPPPTDELTRLLLSLLSLFPLFSLYSFSSLSIPSLLSRFSQGAAGKPVRPVIYDTVTVGAFAAHVMKVREMMFLLAYLHGFSSINRLTIKHSTSKRTNIPCLFDHKSITSISPSLTNLFQCY